MAKKAEKPATNWEDAAPPEGAEQWESLSGAFAPLWKPETGNAIIVQPVEVTPFKTKKKSKVKGASFAIACIFKGGSSANFYSGKGSAATISLGDTIIVGSSYNVQGEDKLIVVEEEGKGKTKTTSARLSQMAELVKKEGAAFRLVFNGQVKTSGPRKVNDITVQVPNGYKEKFRALRA